MVIEYVQKQYNTISNHFDKTIEDLWKAIKEFIKNIDDSFFYY